MDSNWPGPYSPTGPVASRTASMTCSRCDMSYVPPASRWKWNNCGSSISPRSIASASSWMPSAIDSCPSSPAVPTYKPHGSSRTRFSRFATIVSCALFARGRYRRCGSSKHWNVVRAPSRAPGLFDSGTALPSARPYSSKRMMRSRLTSKNSASGPSAHITLNAPNANSSTCSAVTASIGMYGSFTGRPTGRPCASKPSQRTGPSGCSSANATHAMNSVFARPLRHEIEPRLNRRRPCNGCPCGYTSYSRYNAAFLSASSRAGRPLSEPGPKIARSSMNAAICGPNVGHGCSSSFGTISVDISPPAQAAGHRPRQTQGERRARSIRGAYGQHPQRPQRSRSRRAASAAPSATGQGGR